MGKKHNGGFSLVETLVSIVLLGALMVPTCTALVMSIRINDKTEQLLKAQLAVSSAVETLMAEGITGSAAAYEADRFPDVIIETEAVEGKPYYKVTVKDDNTTTNNAGQEVSDPLVVVETTIRAASESEGGNS